MESVFQKYKQQDFLELLDSCSNYISIDSNKAYQAIKELVASHKNKDFSLGKNNIIKKLETRWYKSLPDNPDYAVYNDPYYICDIWACWVMYSRKSLLALKNSKSMVDKSVVDYFNSINTVIDLGCGFGYTTAGLKELFINADVYGTNLKESYQYKVAQSYGRQYGFKVISHCIATNKKIDLVFASEYFEHFYTPIEHLHSVVVKCAPRYMVIANGFNGVAIGHFNTYPHLNKLYTAKTMSRLFNKALGMLGYKKLKTKIWNGRPAIWERVKYA